MPIMEKSYEKLEAKGPGRIPPLMIPLMISNMAAGNVAIHFGLKGKCINVVTACATGTHSIGEAVRAIQCGDADVMVAGGTEAAICSRRASRSSVGCSVPESWESAVLEH